MRLITEKALEKMEEDFDCMVTNDRFCMTLHLTWLSESAYKTGLELVAKAGITYTKPSQGRTIYIKQINLDGKIPMVEERVWLTNKGEVAVLTKEMDHQRLSNCVHLFELFLKAGKLSKSQGDEYLLRLAEGVVPELDERFKGDILAYKPHFPWEKQLMEEAATKSK